LWLRSMQIQKKHSSTLISILVTLVIVTSILASAQALPQILVVQEVEVSPEEVKIGEVVTVEAKIRNKGKNTTTCNVNAYVGEFLVEELNGITIPPRDSFSLLFTIDTSSLEEGAYVIDITVEQAESEEEVFDLGTIAVWQEFVEQETIDQETPEQETIDQDPSAPETTEQEIDAGFNMLYLLLCLPVGAVAAFLVWRRRRNGGMEDEMADELLPKLLEKTLNLEGKAEKGANENSVYDKSYIR